MKAFNIKKSVFLEIFLLCLILQLLSSCVVSSKNGFKKTQNVHSYDCNDYLPDRIILNLTATPSESQAVTWRTKVRLDDPKAWIAEVADSPYLKENIKTINVETEKTKVGKEEFVYHYSAVFKDLKPDILYAYQVGTGKNKSEWNQFKTAGNSNEPFKFVYFGDPQEEIKSKCSRIFRAAYKKAPDASFWLFVGDLVDNGGRDEEWEELFYGFGWIPGMTPMILLPGNHEYPDKRFVKGRNYKLFHLWRHQFTLPENGPKSLEETVYFIDYQGVRFVMLNGNEKLEEQAIWLDSILSENSQSWTIVGIHQPIYSTAKFRNDSKQQALLVPVFDKHSVDLVLQGHDHTYSRTYKMKAGSRVGENEKGTVYVISVSGPKFYPVKTHCKGIMAKLETGKQLFQVIQIDHDRLIYESFDVTGDLHDSFKIKK